MDADSGVLQQSTSVLNAGSEDRYLEEGNWSEIGVDNETAP